MSDQPDFLRALAGETLGRPPVWFMRQAGRYMPEYRAPPPIFQRATQAISSTAWTSLLMPASASVMRDASM